MQKIHRADLIVVAALTACWLVSLAIIGVSGDFSLNDDWAYARAVRRLIAIGQIERASWTWVPAITHSWMGGLFGTLLDVPLLEALRWVGLTTGWIGMLGCYALCRTLGAAPGVSALAAAAFGFNPLYLNLSYTFMTDVPFSAWLVWSLVALCRGARDMSWGWIVFGSLLALGATLTRQTGVAVPMTLAVALIVSAPLDLRSWGMAALANVIVFGGYTLGTDLAYGPRDAGMFFTASAVESAAKSSNAGFHLVKNSLGQISYLGCFAAPLVAACAIVRREYRLWTWGLAGAFAAVGIAGVARLDLEMPPAINVIYNFGLGRRMLSDDVQVVPMAPEWVWWIVVALGFLFFGKALLACLLGALPRLRELRRRPEILLCLGLPFVYLGPHLIRAPYFDRYVLAVFPAMLAVLLVVPIRSTALPRVRAVLAAVALLVLASFAMVGTRDYMQHHRTRAVLLNRLLAQGIDREQIDGGFEFSGLRDVDDDEYRLTDREGIEGYDVIDAASFERWMPPGSEVLRMLRRGARD